MKQSLVAVGEIDQPAHKSASPRTTSSSSSPVPETIGPERLFKNIANRKVIKPVKSSSAGGYASQLTNLHNSFGPSSATDLPEDYPASVRRKNSLSQSAFSSSSGNDHHLHVAPEHSSSSAYPNHSSRIQYSMDHHHTYHPSLHSNLSFSLGFPHLQPASSHPALSSNPYFNEGAFIRSKRKESTPDLAAMRISNPVHQPDTSFSSFLAARRGTYGPSPIIPNLQMLKLADPASSHASSTLSLNDEAAAAAAAASASLSAPSSPTRMTPSPIPHHYQTITAGETSSTRFKVRTSNYIAVLVNSL